MTEYFSENINKNIISENIITESAVPIKAKSTDWYISSTKLKKVYNIENQKKREAFIVQLLKYVRKTPAQIEVRFCDNKIGVIITTRSSQISEIDVDAKNDIIDIRKDIEFYHNEKINHEHT